MKTANPIISALQTGALAWVEGTATPLVDSLTLGELIHHAYQEQSSLGWNVLFRGFWSSSWRLAQEHQFQRMNYDASS